MATTAQLLEAARAATIAVHAAAGLASGARLRDVARVLRAAEGLTRSATVLLAAPSPKTPEPAATAAAKPRRRKRRGKRPAKQEEGAAAAASTSKNDELGAIPIENDAMTIDKSAEEDDSLPATGSGGGDGDTAPCRANIWLAGKASVDLIQSARGYAGGVVDVQAICKQLEDAAELFFAAAPLLTLAAQIRAAGSISPSELVQRISEATAEGFQPP